MAKTRTRRPQSKKNPPHAKVQARRALAEAARLLKSRRCAKRVHGRRCRRDAAPRSKYCWQHQPKPKGTPPRPPARTKPTREFKPFRQRVYRDPRTGRFLAHKKLKRRKSARRQDIYRRPVPKDVRRIRLADGTYIREEDYKRLRALFDWMRTVGYTLSGFRTLQEVKSEYEQVKGHTPRQRSEAVQDRVMDRMTAAFRQAAEEFPDDDDE